MDTVSCEVDDIDIYGGLEGDQNSSVKTSECTKSESSPYPTQFCNGIPGKSTNIETDLNLLEDLLVEDNKERNEKIEKEKLEYRNLLFENSQLKETNKNLQDLVSQISVENTNLKTNISSLYKTSKIQLAYKDKIIADLKRKLDTIIFRRNPLEDNRRQIRSSERIRQREISDNRSLYQNGSPVETEVLSSTPKRKQSMTPPQPLKIQKMLLPDVVGSGKTVSVLNASDSNKESLAATDKISGSDIGQSSSSSELVVTAAASISNLSPRLHMKQPNKTVHSPRMEDLHATSMAPTANATSDSGCEISFTSITSETPSVVPTAIHEALNQFETQQSIALKTLKLAFSSYEKNQGNSTNSLKTAVVGFYSPIQSNSNYDSYKQASDVSMNVPENDKSPCITNKSSEVINKPSEVTNEPSEIINEPSEDINKPSEVGFPGKVVKTSLLQSNIKNKLPQVEENHLLETQVIPNDVNTCHKRTKTVAPFSGMKTLYQQRLAMRILREEQMEKAEEQKTLGNPLDLAETNNGVKSDKPLFLSSNSQRKAKSEDYLKARKSRLQKIISSPRKSSENFPSSATNDAISLFRYHNQSVPYVVQRKLGLLKSKKDSDRKIEQPDDQRNRSHSEKSSSQKQELETSLKDTPKIPDTSKKIPEASDNLQKAKNQSREEIISSIIKSTVINIVKKDESKTSELYKQKKEPKTSDNEFDKNSCKEMDSGHKSDERKSLEKVLNESTKTKHHHKHSLKSNSRRKHSHSSDDSHHKLKSHSHKHSSKKSSKKY